VEDAFDAEMQRRLTHSTWATGCTSWYQTSTGRITNNWPGYTSEYRRRTRRVNLADYHVVTAPKVAEIDWSSGREVMGAAVAADRLTLTTHPDLAEQYPSSEGSWVISVGFSASPVHPK
jgi:hypothetical protein